MSGARAGETLDFYHLPSSCSVAVKAALAATGTPHRVIVVDPANKSEDFLAVNPLGKVPALVADGQALTEGGAINLWLAARHPEAGLMPDLASAEGAEALRWLFYVYATLHPIWVRMFYPQRFCGEGDTEAALQQAEADLFSTYEQIAARLSERDFVTGTRLSLADLYLAATIHWEGKVENRLTARWPQLAAHRDRVRVQPGVAAGFAGEFGYPEAESLLV